MDAPVYSLPPRSRPRIWAVASGKGGVGKSVIASNLAVSFARRGRRCTIVDLDLGCANLHTMLGVPTTGRSIGDFLSRKIDSLDEATARTSVPGLSLIGGDRTSANAANPAYANKQKLLRHIAKIDADDVFLDLGAGAGFNVVDFFLAADCGIVVVTPQPTSIENAYHFLKAAFFRSLRDVARSEPVQVAIELALEQRASLGLRPVDLLRAVAEIDSDAGDALSASAARFSTALILNQVRVPSQRSLGPRIASDCWQHLGAEVRYLGALAADDRVTEAVRDKQPALRLFPGSAFAKDFSKIAEDLYSKAIAPNEEPAADPSHDPVETHAFFASAPRKLPPVDLERPGSYLRRCREHLGIELAEISRRTRIRCLRGIELEDFERLPSERYAREFVAQYASALGIEDVQPIVESFVSLQRAATTT